ncbi:MAG: DHH family phosphoesterase [Candidatus Cloacimonetes bacterium]|nr:DHH family phosphoesterase [Candidatus Cloacimonadota bacterium]
MRIDTTAELKRKFDITLSREQSIALITHKKPDGDGLAACLAFQELLLKHYKRPADIVLEEPPPAVYEFLNAADRCITFSSDMHYDIVVQMDCHEPSRVGTCEPLLQHANSVFAIDHHHEKEIQPESITFIDIEAASTGEILYRMFSSEIIRLPRPAALYIANALYTTILNDTDNFVNSNTKGSTFAICEALCQLGLNPAYITRSFIMGKTPTELKFTGQVFETIEIHCNGQIMFVHSTLKMLEYMGLNQSATSKLTRLLKGAKGVKVLVYFQQGDASSFRLSLRSDTVDVNKLARRFGGGGHTQASGCTISGSLSLVKQTMLNALMELLGDG